MWWLLIVILAHFFYALIFVIDKYIVSRPLPQPVVYAFYVGILSIFIWVLIPFGFYFPSFKQTILALIAGFSQLVGWIFLYKALNKDEVSRVIPFVGAFTAIFILILSTFFIGERFIGERLTNQELMAFILLILGSLIISFRSEKIIQKAFVFAFLGAFLFAIFWVITKFIFLDTPFITGIIWTRTAVFLASFFLLIPRKNRKLIFQKSQKLERKTIKFFLSARALGIFAGLFMYLAVFLGSVILANSLQGLQYAFILILALIFFRKIPQLKEQFSGGIIIQKIIAIILIGLGLAILII